MIPFIPTPTIDCDVRRDHSWLQFSDDRVGTYNYYDVLATALARRKLPAILDQSGNSEYFADWFANVIPAALNMQRRGFGRLDRVAWREKQKEIATEVGAIEEKLLDSRPQFAELLAEAEAWQVEHARQDWADARTKNAARRTPKPESEVECTRATQRGKGYLSRVKKAHEAREKFLNSPKAKSAWLFDELGLRPAPKAPKRPPRSTGQHALLHIYRKLRQKDQHAKWILEDLFHRSKLNTILTRYLGKDSRYPPFAVGADDRVYYHLRAYASETLRWSCSDPALHQWPPEIRGIIRARPGHVFISGDWKALEVRVIAYYAQEQKDIDILEDSSRDIHDETVWDLFPDVAKGWAEMPYELQRQYRTFAKNKRYELNYGGSGMGHQAKAFCPCERCVGKAPDLLELTPARQKVIMQRWAVVRERTARWKSEVLEQVKRNGRRWTCPVGGYTRQFLRPAGEIKTELANYPMQHTGAELMNRALVELDAREAPVVFQHHDEIILEVLDNPATIEAGERTLKDVMETPIEELGGVVFPIDLHVGHSWADLK